MNKRFVTFLVVVVILSSCGPKESAPPPQEKITVTGDSVLVSKEQLSVSGIELGQVQPRGLSGGLKVTGMLDVPPQNLVNITAPLGGFLRSTDLLQGMRVTKGQVIAVIENPEYIQLQQDYLDTKSQADYLETEYQRQKQLAAENVNAQKTLQKSIADLTSMKARNSGLRAKLKMLSIDADQLQPEFIKSTIELRAPITGFVTRVFSAIGAFVAPTEVMFTIVDTEHLHAELVCFERDLPGIKIGQKIRLTLAQENTERTATVYLIGKEISAERTVRIHGHLDHEDRNLIPGMYLKAIIQTGTEQVSSLPEEAVLNFEGKQVIIVQVNGEIFRLMEVTTGISENGFVQVILPDSFDKAKTQVVVRNAYKLLSKMKNSDSGL